MRFNFGGYELSGTLHVCFVLGQSAHAGNAKQVFQFVQESLLVLACVANGG